MDKLFLWFFEVRSSTSSFAKLGSYSAVSTSQSGAAVLGALAALLTSCRKLKKKFKEIEVNAPAKIPEPKMICTN